MTRKLSVLTRSLTTGCVSIHGGLEGGLPSTGHPVHATVNVDYGAMFEDTGFAYDARLRMGLRGVELSAGARGCVTPNPGWRPVDLCARAYALEVGAQRGELTLGVLSPALGVRFWVPNESVLPPPFPKKGSILGSSLMMGTVVSVWLGYDVRIVQASHRTPYLGVTVGYGGHGVPNSSVPEHVKRRNGP